MRLEAKFLRNINRKITFSIIFSLFFQQFLYPAISPATMIKTKTGTVPVYNLKVGDKVVSNNNDTNVEVKKIEVLLVDSLVKIETDEETFYCSLDQYFFDPSIFGWVSAEDLTTENTLIDFNLNFHKCINVSIIKIDSLVYDISLDFPHLFFITDSQILTHNNPAAALFTFFSGAAGSIARNPHAARGFATFLKGSLFGLASWLGLRKGKASTIGPKPEAIAQQLLSEKRAKEAGEFANAIASSVKKASQEAKKNWNDSSLARKVAQKFWKTLKTGVTKGGVIVGEFCVYTGGIVSGISEASKENLLKSGKYIKKTIKIGRKSVTALVEVTWNIGKSTANIAGNGAKTLATATAKTGLQVLKTAKSTTVKAGSLFAKIAGKTFEHTAKPIGKATIKSTNWGLRRLQKAFFSMFSKSKISKINVEEFVKTGSIKNFNSTQNVSNKGNIGKKFSLGIISFCKTAANRFTFRLFASKHIEIANTTPGLKPSDCSTVVKNIKKDNLNLVDRNGKKLSAAQIAKKNPGAQAGSPNPNGKDPKDKENKERIKNEISKTEFFHKPEIKKDYKFLRESSKGALYKREPGRAGVNKDAEYIYWDYTHNDIEVFNANKKHIGSLDPIKYIIYKIGITWRPFPK